MAALLAEEPMSHLTEDDINSGNSYHYLMEIFEDGTQKKLDDAWLTSCGFVKNKAKDQSCYICHHNVDEGVMVYNIMCNNELLHPLHTECAQLHIKHNGKTCPAC